MMGTPLSPMSGIYGLIVCLTVLVTLHCDKAPTRMPKRGVGLFKLVISKRTAYHVGKTQQRSQWQSVWQWRLHPSWQTAHGELRPDTEVGIPLEVYLQSPTSANWVTVLKFLQLLKTAPLSGEPTVQTHEPEGAVCTFKTWCLSLVPIDIHGCNTERFSVTAGVLIVLTDATLLKKKKKSSLSAARYLCKVQFLSLVALTS